MKANKELDCYDYISLQMNILKRIKLWFISSHSVRSFKFWLELFASLFVGFIFFLVPNAGALIYVIKLSISGTVNIQETASNLSILSAEMVVTMRLIVLFIRQNSLAELISQMTGDDFQRVFNEYRPNFENTIKISMKIFILLTCSSYVIGFFQLIVAPGFKGFQELPVKMDFVFIDHAVLSSGDYFAYVFAFQVMYTIILIPAYSAIQTMMWAFMLFANSQLDALINSIENMKRLVANAKVGRRCDESEAYKHVLKRFIYHHRTIIRFVKQIDKTFSEALFFTLLLTSCNICTSAVQILSFESKMENIAAILWVTAMIAAVGIMFFIDCYFADTISFKGLQLATLAYNSPWINMSPSVKRNLIFFINRTQQPLQIYAGAIVPISLTTFKQVMNWTYKGFALMNQM